MTEKLFRDANSLENLHDPTAASGTPGKSTLTSRMHSARPSQVIFRVESPEAAQVFADAFGPRDSNGVAAEADTAVDRASSSSGSGLPGELRERFESSLGADLSSVRVHTGSESASAAGAVGAKAYTVGNDIHFGAGHFDTSSEQGQLLIAHEVAHTVQQAGSAPTRQNKLEVSSPGDALEADADRAAVAMVRGEAAAVIGGGSGIGRKVFRDAYSDVSTAGDDAAGDKESEIAQERTAEDKTKVVGDGKTASYLGSSNIGDRDQAIQMVGTISSQNAAIAASTKTDKLEQNNAAVEALRGYVTASADQNFAQSIFEPEFEKVKVQFARLESMFQAHFAQHGVTPNASGDGNDIANQAATAGTQTKADDASDLKRQIQGQSASADPVKNNEMQMVKADIQAIQNEMAKYGPAIAGTTDAVMTAHKELRNSQNASQIPPALAEDEKEKTAKASVEGIKNDLAAAVATVNAIGSIVKQGVDMIPGGEAVTKTVSTAKENLETGINLGKAAAREPGGSFEKTDLTESVVKYFTNFDAKIASAEGVLKSVQAGKHADWARNAIDLVKTKGGALKAAWSAHERAQKALQALSLQLRMQTDKLVRLMPKAAPGQPDLGVMLALQNEATIFNAQADGAIAVAERERTEAKGAKDAKNKAASGDYKVQDPAFYNELVAHKTGLTWWLCRRIEFVDESPEAYQFHEQKVTFAKTPKTEMNTQEALDSNMDRCIERMKTMKKTADAFAKRMAALTGIGPTAF